MDRLYGNVKEGHHSKWIDEAIYANDIGHDVESDNTVYALAGHAGLKVNTKRSCRAAALFLGLLCLLLLAGLVALVFLYTRDNSNWKTERVHLQTSLAEEKDQLNKTLALQSQEKWIYFRRSFYYVSSTRKPWNESRWDCRQKDADLVIINNDEEQVCDSLMPQTVKNSILINLFPLMIRNLSEDGKPACGLDSQTLRRKGHGHGWMGVRWAAKATGQNPSQTMPKELKTVQKYIVTMNSKAGMMHHVKMKKTGSVKDVSNRDERLFNIITLNCSFDTVMAIHNTKCSIASYNHFLFDAVILKML
ncbi:uncharacterized protein LOC114863062 isoform X1 [Betta splendens]|uniref:Uncharacterized protein LOC114863062 isoform X1 n=1 Tax=Betta splendens TaxID=158456 RepID=A0A6P7NNX9_BETSP|nr:uncharacterized protein LOC114863062 isoform X1 [Betta splendens]